ncbi:MAG: NUDIX domain-containing protein [Candidatus Pacebacteria bacterium]|nr:NUDIX domain-containing protein [Candidatus Paceibacterota bacterium]
MQERPTFPVGVNVFVIKDGKLLLGQRKNTSGDGLWGLPGGHLETGENMIDCARRELKEETSLEAEKFTFTNLANDNGPTNNRHYVQVGMIAEGVKGEVKLTEPELCYEWKWFDLKNLPKELFFGHKNQIELFLKRLPFGDGIIK